MEVLVFLSLPFLHLVDLLEDEVDKGGELEAVVFPSQPLLLPRVEEEVFLFLACPCLKVVRGAPLESLCRVHVLHLVVAVAGEAASGFQVFHLQGRLRAGAEDLVHHVPPPSRARVDPF